ncbi:MAG: SAM-dependent methyltransferase [Burkholderiales bacterium 28-67-8]|nr:MAG: SAM-dependent methyltransferase [Burkholderiales bacterium 28-67-8]
MPADASAPVAPEPPVESPAEPVVEPSGPLIVALGASAGGLEAYEQFFRVMPVDSGYAFVLVQHLDPRHASLLTEILQRSTTMPVVEAVDQMELLPNRVHAIPPNRDMLVMQGRLRLHLPLEPHGQRMPIDSFFRSLASDQGDRAVGIILSGSGSDGTLGMRAIFGAGGLCLVQDPDTAKFAGMPQSALHAGYVNQVLRIDKMPQALHAAAQMLPARRTSAVSSSSGAAADPAGVDRILALLRSATGHDFSQYKKQTIGRRIERRMAQHLTTSTEVYARYLQQQPQELKALFRELLINVTSFFRDPEAFDALKREVLPAMIQAKSADLPLRIWVAGCSTGEEAYSIAMVLRELMEGAPHQLKIQFYATDLDDEAIATARAGLYPLNIAQDVSPERLRRFFLLEGDSYRVKKDIREMVVFAVQNLIQDPPFTRLDLLSCRNVMIYLEPELQGRVVPAFHYALRPGGVLFLSPSESIGSHTELFEPLNRKWNFFRARPSFASTRTMLTSGLKWTVDPGSPGYHSPVQPGRDGTNMVEFAKRALLQSFAPPAVLTDVHGEVLYVHGDTGKFLRVAQGQPSRSVTDMAREGLELELREALRRAGSKSQATINQRVTIRDDGHLLPVDLSVRLLPDVQTGRTLLLLSFQERSDGAEGAVAVTPKPRARPVPQRVSDLELELDYARTRLKSLLEEQQASNEELKSINEELQSTNEELQSSNEELETSKEELQSVNEELVTVNSELQTKIEQMVGMQDDMKNLLENIRVGTVFLDTKLQIRRFTREATRVYRLLASDLGRPLADIRTELQGGDPIADARTVLDSLSSIERELSLPDGTWFLTRTQPYRTVDNVIDGVVLTFTDVTERVHAIANRQARDLAEAVVDTVPEPLLVLDGTLKVMSANRAYFRQFGGAVAGALGQPFFGLERGQWDFAAMRDLLENVLPRDEHFEGRVIEHDFAALGVLRLSLNAHRVVMPAQSGEMTMLVINLLPPNPAGS